MSLQLRPWPRPSGDHPLAALHPQALHTVFPWLLAPRLQLDKPLCPPASDHGQAWPWALVCRVQGNLGCWAMLSGEPRTG